MTAMVIRHCLHAALLRAATCTRPSRLSDGDRWTRTFQAFRTAIASRGTHGRVAAAAWRGRAGPAGGAAHTDDAVVTSIEGDMDPCAAGQLEACAQQRLAQRELAAQLAAEAATAGGVAWGAQPTTLVPAAQQQGWPTTARVALRTGIYILCAGLLLLAFPHSLFLLGFQPGCARAAACCSCCHARVHVCLARPAVPQLLRLLPLLPVLPLLPLRPDACLPTPASTPPWRLPLPHRDCRPSACASPQPRLRWLGSRWRGPGLLVWGILYRSCSG